MGDDKPKVVDTVEKTLKAGGEHATQDAYKALKQDFDDYAKNHNAADTKTYLDQVTAEIEKSSPGALPKMALEWANQNVGDPFMTGGKGRWEKGTLDGVANAGPDSRAFQSGFLNSLDQAMAKQVVGQWDKLKEDDNGMWFGGTDVITSERLNKRLSEVNNDLSFERVQRDDREQIKPYIAQLMRSSDGSGKDSLFNTMDELPGGRKDGKINKDDLQRYRDEYDRHYDASHPGTGAWSKENRELVDKLLQGWDDSKNPNYQLAQMVRGSVATKDGSHYIPVPSEYPVSVENRKNNGVNYTESNDFVTADSLRTALGADKNTDLYQQFKGTADAPTPVTDNPQGPPSPTDTPHLDRENSRKLANMLLTLPSDLQQEGSPMFENGKITPKSIQAALGASKELSNRDRQFLDDLSKNWPKGLEGGVTLDDLKKSGEFTGNQFEHFAALEHMAAKSVVDGLHQNVSIDMVQGTDGNITKESVRAAIDKRRQELTDGVPNGEQEAVLQSDKRFSALQNLAQNFDDIARDGRTNITEDDLNVYAKNHVNPDADKLEPLKWQGFAKKEDLEKPPTDNPTDNPTEGQIDKAKAQAALDAVHGNVARADIPGDITPANIDQAIANARGKYGDDGETHADDPKIAALQALKDNYAAIAGGKDKIDEADIKAFADKNGLKWEGFAAESAPSPESDPKLDEALKAFDGMKQEDAIQKRGEYPYDVALRSLTERSKLTGEPTDYNSVMREVARIVIVNGIGSEETRANLQKLLDDPNGKVTGSKLPAALNGVRIGQPLKLYGEGDRERYAKIAADRAKAQP